MSFVYLIFVLLYFVRILCRVGVVRSVRIVCIRGGGLRIISGLGIIIIRVMSVFVDRVVWYVFRYFVR